MPPGAIQDRFKADFIVKLEVRFPIFFTYSECIGGWNDDGVPAVTYLGAQGPEAIHDDLGYVKNMGNLTSNSTIKSGLHGSWMALGSMPGT